MISKKLVLLSFFAGIGGLARYGLGLLLPNLINLLVINLIGTFFLAFFVKGYLTYRKTEPHLILALGTGLAGGFTSFSSLMLDLTNLLEGGQVGLASLYLLAHLIGGFILVTLAQKWAERLGWV